MFGDLMGMMRKLKETQEKLEAAKARMESVKKNAPGADVNEEA